MCDFTWNDPEAVCVLNLFVYFSAISIAFCVLLLGVPLFILSKNQC